MSTTDETSGAARASGPAKGTRRRRDRAALLAIVLIAVGGVIAVVRKTNQVAQPPATTYAVTRVAGVTTRLVLAQTTVRSGGDIRGTVVVSNASGVPIHSTDCSGPFAVELHTARFGQSVNWADCAIAFTIPPGRSTYPVTVHAKYLTCTRRASDVSKAMPMCVGDGLKPPGLPKGRYEAYVAGQSDQVPSAPPVVVIVN